MGWMKTELFTPSNTKGNWSRPVIALADNFEIFKLSYMDGIWQRSQPFVDSGAKSIIGWMEIPEFK